ASSSLCETATGAGIGGGGTGGGGGGGTGGGCAGRVGGDTVAAADAAATSAGIFTGGFSALGLTGSLPAGSLVWATRSSSDRTLVASSNASSGNSSASEWNGIGFGSGVVSV